MGLLHWRSCGLPNSGLEKSKWRHRRLRVTGLTLIVTRRLACEVDPHPVMLLPLCCTTCERERSPAGPLSVLTSRLDCTAPFRGPAPLPCDTISLPLGGPAERPVPCDTAAPERTAHLRVHSPLPVESTSLPLGCSAGRPCPRDTAEPERTVHLRVHSPPPVESTSLPLDSPSERPVPGHT